MTGGKNASSGMDFLDMQAYVGITKHTGGIRATDELLSLCHIEEAREAGLTNVETRVAGAYELPLEGESIDRAFLVTVLPEVPDRDRALAELWRVIKPGGRLSVTEEFMDPDYPFPFETIRRVEAAGFDVVQRFGGFWVYTINFRKRA
jgi:ubiquinone/menaquinone biosynthesis C-methylase UbiE